MRTDEVGKFGNPHQAGVSLRCVHEHIRNDGGGGQALLLQRNSVEQTARRATPSITYPGDHHIGVPVKVGHHFRRRWQRR